MGYQGVSAEAGCSEAELWHGSTKRRIFCAGMTRTCYLVLLIVFRVAPGAASWSIPPSSRKPVQSTNIRNTSGFPMLEVGNPTVDGIDR